MTSDNVLDENRHERLNFERRSFGGLISDIKPFVIIESPFMGLTEGDDNAPHSQSFNIRYARAAIRDSVLRGEAPFASHLLYTQPGILRDEVNEERELGMDLGWHIMRRSNYVVAYGDLGFSSGMIRGLKAALDAGLKIKMRFLSEVYDGSAWCVVPRSVTPSPDVDLVLRNLEVES